MLKNDPSSIRRWCLREAEVASYAEVEPCTWTLG
jgi:hypothetical protein